MIKRDPPVGSLATYPNCRHQYLDRGSILALNQLFGPKRSVVHNHPSGDPTPSRADIQMTQSICEVARSLGIAVHDHIIVGKEGHASFKGLKLI
jgi:hypothetical protein